MIVGNEPFAVVLPDVLVQNEPGCLKQMVDAYAKQKDKANLIAVEEVPMDRVHMLRHRRCRKRFGPNASDHADGRKAETRGSAVEPHQSPGAISCSRRSSTSLKTSRPARAVKSSSPTRMIRLSKDQPFYAVKFDGRSYDCGSKLGFLTANIAYALKRKDLAPELREELKQLLG